jgi:hypothetical protein
MEAEEQFYIENHIWLWRHYAFELVFTKNEVFDVYVN